MKEHVSIGEFLQDGSIKRLKFYNFMQYQDTELLVGPNLNVIIGPNGSGKSSIVNGICLGLGGKTSVLGRSNSIADFVLVGKEQASIEIELHLNNRENLVIRRKFDIHGKNSWSMDGKKVSEKEVKDRVAKLKIQVDNLCQFLPQDKVHDFSRLNSKGLLDSTIDAVGETRLKDKHAELKELQRFAAEGEEMTIRKMEIVEEKKAQCDRLEEDVRSFEEKRKLLDKIEKLGHKRLWSRFEESRRAYSQLRDSYTQVKRRWEDQDKILAPLKEQLSKTTRQKDNTVKAALALENSLKELSAKAKAQSKNIEDREEELERIRGDLADIDRRDKEKEDAVKKAQRDVRDLEKEIEEGFQDKDLNSKAEEAKKNSRQQADKLEKEREKLSQHRLQLRSLESAQRSKEQELRLLQDVNNQKLEVLKQKSPDAHKALLWLRNNRTMFSGEVYEPVIVSANVTDAENAIYLENCINLRDLTIFFFEETQDMNVFLNETRRRQGLERVSAAQVPNRCADEYQPRVEAAKLVGCGLVAYVKEMLTAPDKVLSYLCQHHNLHNTAVFRPEAEKQHSDRIANQFKLTKFFFGTKCQTVSGSSYSGRLTTHTAEVKPHNTLSHSLDQDRICATSAQICQLSEARKDLEAKISSADQDIRQMEALLETSRQTYQELERKRGQARLARTRLESLRQKLRGLLSAGSEAADERRQLLANRQQAVRSQVVYAAALVKTIGETTCLRSEAEMRRVAVAPLQRTAEELTERLDSLKEEMSELKGEVAVAERGLEEGKNVMMDMVKQAKAATGLEPGTKDKPPAVLRQFWEKEVFPDSVEDIDRLAGQLEAQASCTDTVDKSVVEKYLRLKDEVAELKRDLAMRTREVANVQQRMAELKQEWLSILTDLVDNINKRFSHFFSVLGFAGEVRLAQGSHDNDFEHYGLKIFVKYREREPLQELTPNHQSGGERSVATAIYMLALQALTTVPFRCVDEINQGMDVRNERLVFDLLVNTSCKENNAQYFLLTPKLLPGLDYDPRMNVLIVHNGHAMLHYAQWNINTFLARSS